MAGVVCASFCFLFFFSSIWKPNLHQWYKDRLKDLMYILWDIFSPTNGSGDQENTSDENQSKRGQSFLCPTEDSCRYQDYTSRVHCSPCLRERLRDRNPLQLREREAENEKCLSADRSGMSLWLGVRLGKCQAVPERIPCRTIWQLLLGNQFFFVLEHLTNAPKTCA